MPCGEPDVPRYDPARPLVSLHIPKTAGTSFRAALQTWFGAELHPHYRSAAELPSRHDLGPGSCVHGHFDAERGFGVAAYYPQATQYITFFREPYARCVSFWRYQQQRQAEGAALPELEDDPDFETWLLRRLDRRRENGGAFTAQLPGYPNVADTVDLIRTRFIGVGLTEDYDVSTALIAAALGKPAPAPSERLNVTRGALGDYARHRSAYERAFPDEFEVYEAARAHHRVLLRTFGVTSAA